MKISTKGRYGLRGLVDMAAYSCDRPVSLAKTARRQNISLNYLEQVFGILKKAKIVDSVKGPGGGYSLARSAEDITVQEILEVLEGEFSIIERHPQEDLDPVQEAIQNLIWDRIDQRVNDFLHESKLSQLVEEYKKKLQ